tara:strand:+ start:14542 stop:15780 length:1239 start_codon:yes stop_codon:yes gene_type:complete
MNDKRCVKPMNQQRQKRPMLRRVQTVQRQARPLQLLSFGKPKHRATVKPTFFLKSNRKDDIEPHERRLAEQRVDKHMNHALKMNNDERMMKFGTVDMKNIHVKLLNVERKKIISMREKKMKMPMYPVVKPVTKVISPHKLIKQFLLNSPVQIIRPKKTISQMMREEVPKPDIPQLPTGGVYDRIAKKAGIKITKPKKTKTVKEKPPVELYEKERCSKKTSNMPYTVSQLRRIAKSMNIPKADIINAKTSVKKLCALIEVSKNKNNAPHVNKNASMKRRISMAKKVLRRNQNREEDIKTVNKKHEILSPKKDGTPWMKRDQESRKRHKNANNNIYKNALSTLKKDDPVMFLKMKGFNAGRVGRKTKTNPVPHTQNNLIKIARELNINIPTTSKKPKPTATTLIGLIKKKLEIT